MGTRDKSFPSAAYRGQIELARARLATVPGMALDVTNAGLTTGGPAGFDNAVNGVCDDSHNQQYFSKYYDLTSKRWTKWDFSNREQMKLWIEYTLASHRNAGDLITDLFRVKSDLDWLYDNVAEYNTKANVQAADNCPTGHIEIFSWNGDMYNTEAHKTVHANNYNFGRRSIVEGHPGGALANTYNHKLCLPQSI